MRGQELRDPVTGQPMFAPRTGRAPHGYKRNQGKLPVGDYLYALRPVPMAPPPQQASPPRTSQRSEALLNRLKARRFEQVFEYLDAEHSGCLDLLDVAVGGSPRFASLSAEIRADVEAAALLHAVAAGAAPPAAAATATLTDTPARCAALVHAHAGAHAGSVPKPELAVDARAFQEVMHSVLVKCRGLPRAYLLPDVTIRAEDDSPTFRPQINERSAALAQRRWRDPERPVFEHLHEHAKTVQVHRTTRSHVCVRLCELSLNACIVNSRRNRESRMTSPHPIPSHGAHFEYSRLDIQIA
jgi:hypothetical protein